MSCEIKRCNICGNTVEIIENGGGTLVCCGEEMETVVPNRTEAPAEKHIPVCHREGNTLTVTVGSDRHPMTDAHFIKWIAVETTRGKRRTTLLPGSLPEACFALCEGETVLSVCAFCNLHGLWESSCR